MGQHMEQRGAISIEVGTHTGKSSAGGDVRVSGSASSTGAGGDIRVRAGDGGADRGGDVQPVERNDGPDLEGSDHRRDASLRLVRKSS